MNVLKKIFKKNDEKIKNVKNVAKNVKNVFLHL